MLLLFGAWSSFQNLPGVVCSSEKDNSSSERFAVEIADDSVKDTLVGRRWNSFGHSDANVTGAGFAVKHFDSRLAVRSFAGNGGNVRPVESLN